MQFTFSEKDKKLLVVVLVLIIGFGLFQFVISPMMASIDEKTKKYEEVLPKYEAMKKVVDDKSAKIKYEKVKKDSKENFEKIYKSFAVDEKIASIADEQGVHIRSLNIPFYENISADDYTNNIVQPETVGKNEKVNVDTSNLDLFLVTKIGINVQGTYQQILNFIDAVNNVPIIGPGEGEIQRYCLQIPTIQWSTSDVLGGSDVKITKDLSICLYGMEPPPEN